MSDKDFKVKNKLQVKGITSAGPVVSDASGNLDSTAYVATQYGGTGTSTSPSSGQVVYSASGTTYAPTTLTSLDVKGATYASSAPSSPVVGQIWVDSSSTGTSVDPNLIRRQAFTSTAGQTVYTTNVAFIDGYEQVFFNGMLLLRTTDYTTSGNNTITLTSAAAVNDIVEVVTVTNLNSTNTYTQGEIDTALSAKLSTSTAASTYLTQSNASSTYLPSTTAASTYLTQTNAASTYLTPGTAASTYLSQSNAATTYVPQTSYSVAGKNAVINGGFDIWQRGTSFTTSGYTADRWYSAIASSVTTVSRQSPGASLPQFQYALRTQRNSGSTDTTGQQLGHTLETADSLRFAGQTITVSFYARVGANYSAASSVLYFLLNYGTGTDQRLLAAGFTGNANLIFQGPVVSTSWQRISYSIAIPSTATEIGFYWQANVAGTAGANDWFEITGVQLELGSVLTNFSRATGNIQPELAACMRYYQKSFTYATTPANNSSDLSGPLISPNFIRTGTYEPSVQAVLPVPMRAAATATLYNLYTGASGQWSDGSTVTSNARVLQSGPKTFYADNTDVLMSFTNANIHYTLDAEL